MVARQPIYGANLSVRGYELLFRDRSTRTTDGIAMTADVLVRAGLDMGLGDLVGDKAVFVQAPRPFLVGDLEFPLPPRQTVIEIAQTWPVPPRWWPVAAIWCKTATPWPWTTTSGMTTKTRCFTWSRSSSSMS